MRTLIHTGLGMLLLCASLQGRAQPSMGKTYLHLLGGHCARDQEAQLDWYVQNIYGDTSVRRLLGTHALGTADTTLALEDRGNVIVWKQGADSMRITIRNFRVFKTVSVLIDSLRFTPGDYTIDGSKLKLTGYDDPRPYACHNCYELTARPAARLEE